MLIPICSIIVELVNSEHHLHNNCSWLHRKLLFVSIFKVSFFLQLFGVKFNTRLVFVVCHVLLVPICNGIPNLMSNTGHRWFYEEEKTGYQKYQAFGKKYSLSTKDLMNNISLINCAKPTK